MHLWRKDNLRQDFLYFFDWPDMENTSSFCLHRGRATEPDLSFILSQLSQIIFMRDSQLLNYLQIMPQTLLLSSLEYFKQSLILFFKILGDLAVLRLEGTQMIASWDLEISHLLNAPLSLLKKLTKIVLEHLHVVRLVVFYDALHADPPPTVQTIGLALVPRVQRTHRIETPNKNAVRFIRYLLSSSVFIDFLHILRNLLVNKPLQRDT